MPIFILVRQLVLLVFINSALIMSPPARTINKTPLNSLVEGFSICLFSTLMLPKVMILKTEGEDRHWLERYHFVVSTLSLSLKINFDQPIKWMEFQKLAEIKWLPVNL